MRAALNMPAKSSSPSAVVAMACDRKSPIVDHKCVNNVGVNCGTPSQVSPTTNNATSSAAVFRTTATELCPKDPQAILTKDSTTVSIASTVRPRQINLPSRRRWTDLEQYLAFISVLLLVTCVGLILLVALTRTAPTGRDASRDG